MGVHRLLGIKYSGDIRSLARVYYSVHTCTYSERYISTWPSLIGQACCAIDYMYSLEPFLLDLVATARDMLPASDAL